MTAAAEQRLKLAPHIAALEPYEPGRPIEDVKREFGLAEVVKLASNENPLGPSPKAVEALREAAFQCNLYPDGACGELRAALSAHLAVPSECLAFGNGSDEILHFLGLALLEPGDEVVTGDLTFSRYEAAARLNCAKLVTVPLRDWTFDAEAIAAAFNERTRLVFIANPNNPTGTAITQSDFERLLDRLPERAWLVMDEAYFEFVDDPKHPRSIGAVLRGCNLIALRTFSKAYGLAGLRVGYGVAPPDLVVALNRVREPFNVSLVAQKAAIAALGDVEHLDRTVELNRAGRAFLTRSLRDMGFEVAPSQANFVWTDLRRDAKEVFHALLRRGVIVRAGLGHPTAIRVSVGTEVQNAAFLHHLKEVVGR